MDALTAETLPKALVYVCGQLLTGLVVVRWLSPATTDSRAQRSGWWARAALLVTTALVVGSLWRAWAHTAAAFGAADAWAVENLRVVALDSRWGQRWQWQLHLGVAALVVASVSARFTAAWVVLAAIAGGLAVVTPLVGHAAGSPVRQALHATHLLASSVWIGGLGVLAVLGLASGGDSRRADTFAHLVRRFSPFALPAALITLVTGGVTALQYLSRVDELRTTTYGVTLSFKLGLVAVVLACGFFNWQRSRRGLRPLIWLVVLEWSVALAVVLATAIVTETEHP